MAMDEMQGRVLDFWFRELTPQHWFAAGKALDPLVRERFGDLHAAASAGALDHWAGSPLGRLALVIVLDQFSRHIHRDAPQAFAQDGKAQQLALAAIAAGEDERLSFEHRHFLYMPLMHAEDPALQERSIERFAALGRFAQELQDFARTHSDEIARFGRFPYRNAALSRPCSEAERDFLRERSKGG